MRQELQGSADWPRLVELPGRSAAKPGRAAAAQGATVPGGGDFQVGKAGSSHDDAKGV